MGKGRRFLEELAMDPRWEAELIACQPIVELSGDRRVLIENHNGVGAYTQESISVNVKFGCVCVSGCGLELRRMTKEQLVITGKISGITLKRREA